MEATSKNRDIFKIKFYLSAPNGHAIHVSRDDVEIEKHPPYEGDYAVTIKNAPDKFRFSFVIRDLQHQLVSGPGNIKLIIHEETVELIELISYEEAAAWIKGQK